MKVLYFDCFSGISGDMAMAALLDLGVDSGLLLNELAKLELDGYRIEITKKSQSGIIGTDIDVILTEEHDLEHSHEHEQDHDNEHGHEHGHDHEHEHEHKHDRDHVHAHRNLRDIEEIIDKSGLKQKVKDISKKIFREIAIAEGKVHNKPLEEVHFHEVGAVDSIVDIVGVSICLDLLGVEKVLSSPLHDGHGFIKCQHGIIPVPVPAVMEMLKESGIPLISEDISTELITPTGMGIIKCISSGFGRIPAMSIDRIGYGMGKRNTGRLNALRVVLGNTFEEESVLEEVTILETNIDDMSSEILGYTMERLLEKGALDVFYTPIYMKKNRPAVMLTVLCRKEKEKELTEILFRETTTLGIRKSVSSRYCMDRETMRVKTRCGDIRVKIASSEGIRKISPEYEDCRAIALNTGLPLKEVYDLAYESCKQLDI